MALPIEQLDAFFQEFPVLLAGPANSNEIDTVEAFAGFRLPTDYQEFLQRYGAGIVGSLRVYGIGAAEAMGAAEASVIDTTKQSRANGWPLAETGLVISDDGRGHPIVLSADGVVRVEDIDVNGVEVIAEDFGSFLRGLLDSL